MTEFSVNHCYILLYLHYTTPVSFMGFSRPKKLTETCLQIFCTRLTDFGAFGTF
jgi:hypothetical protein